MEAITERKRWSVAWAAGVTLLVIGLMIAGGAGWLVLRWKLSEELTKALEREDYPAVRSLVRRGADPSTQDEWPDKGGTDNTALLLAVRNQDLPFVRELISRRADLEDPTTEGITPLLTALAYKRLDIAQALLEAGADANNRTHDLYTPLMHAASEGDVDAVRLLLKHGAKVSLADRSGNTTLSMAHPRVGSLLKQALAAERTGAKASSNRAEQTKR